MISAEKCCLLLQRINNLKRDLFKERDMTNKKVRRHTIVEQVMERIRDLISSGEYKVGDKFPNENSLAERFGIGRSSVREAIKILHYIGVLHSSTGRGTYICDWKNISTEALTWVPLLSEMDYNEIMDFRFAIETQCISSLTAEYGRKEANATATVEGLSIITAGLKKAADECDTDTLIGWDYEFHNVIIQHSKNTVFVSIYAILRSFLIDVTKKMLTQYEEPINIYLEHNSILESIKSGNPIKSAPEIYAHIEKCKVLIKAILK